jgi:hypothetical protein
LLVSSDPPVSCSFRSSRVLFLLAAAEEIIRSFWWTVSFLSELAHEKKKVTKPTTRCNTHNTGRGRHTRGDNMFTVMVTMCGAAPCLLETRDKNFGSIYGNDDEMAGGPGTRCR